MGQRVIVVNDGSACFSCWGYLEPGESVHTYYGNVPGIMPDDGEAFGVPVKCSCCSLEDAKEKKNQKKKTTHLGCRGAD